MGGFFSKTRHTTIDDLVFMIVFQITFPLDHQKVLDVFEAYDTETLSKMFVSKIESYSGMSAQVCDSKKVPSYVPFPRCPKRFFLLVSNESRSTYVSVCDGSPYISMTQKL